MRMRVVVGAVAVLDTGAVDDVDVDVEGREGVGTARDEEVTHDEGEIEEATIVEDEGRSSEEVESERASWAEFESVEEENEKEGEAVAVAAVVGGEDVAVVVEVDWKARAC